MKFLLFLIFTACVCAEQNNTSDDNILLNDTTIQHSNDSYKCVFFNIKHCIIFDNVLYMLIAMNIMLVGGLILYFIFNIYKFCSIYNNFNEAKKMFAELKSTSKI